MPRVSPQEGQNSSSTGLFFLASTTRSGGSNDAFEANGASQGTNKVDTSASGSSGDGVA